MESDTSDSDEEELLMFMEYDEMSGNSSQTSDSQETFASSFQTSDSGRTSNNSSEFMFVVDENNQLNIESSSPVRSLIIEDVTLPLVSQEQPSTSAVVQEREASNINSQGDKSKCSSSNVETPLSDGDDDDGQTCPICFDHWTNLGEHRICALKCGHLFGLKCIERWFIKYKNKTCPTCKVRAQKEDIRYIYTRKLIAMDVSELEVVKSELRETMEQKNKLQIELSKAISKERAVVQQVQNLTEKVKHLESLLKQKQYSKNEASYIYPNIGTVCLSMDKSLEVSKDGGCRVLDYYEDKVLIAASVISPNMTLFPGYGVRVTNVVTCSPLKFLPLHTKPIRDVRFHNSCPWLLSVSLDKTIKVTHSISNATVAMNTTCDFPLWSCCWDINNDSMLYVGTQQGSIKKFDIRMINETLCELDVPGDMSPVISIASTSPSSFCRNGIISCKLNSLWMYEANNADNDYTRYPLQVEGPFCSMSYDDATRHLLVSTRANSRYPYSRHLICNFERKTPDTLSCNTVHSFIGSSTQKYLSRSCLMSNDSVDYVAAYQESNKRIFLWSMQTGDKICSLPASDPVLDLCSVSAKDNFLVALTEKKLNFFKFK